MLVDGLSVMLVGATKYIPYTVGPYDRYKWSYNSYKCPKINGFAWGYNPYKWSYNHTYNW